MNTSKTPLVSVVIPSFNNKKWLAEALDSVFNQTYKNWEIIVDDESDKPEEIATDLPQIKHERVTYIQSPNGGIGYSRNIGLSHAKGKYIALLDSDDFWEPKKLEIQVEAMERANAAWCQHNYYYYVDETGDRGKIINTYQYRNCVPKIIFLSFKVQSSSFMFRRDVFTEEDIRYDESGKYGPGEEWPVYIGFAEKYKLLCIDQVLTNFRIRAKNSGFNVKAQIYGRKKVWDEYKNHPFFIKNTGVLTRTAYRLCVFGNMVSEKLKLDDYSSVVKILYFLPWSIFKAVTWFEIKRS